MTRHPLLSSLLALLLVLFAAHSAVAQSRATASVSGTVADDTGATLPGITVTATRAGTGVDSEVVVTEMDGKFVLDGLAPGAYTLQAALDGFQTVIRELTLVTGQRLEVGFTLVPAFSEMVEVVAESTRTGEVAILESRRQSAVVSDSISAEEISKTPDSSAAGVVERLTGVTLVGEKYVFVRGLGERYSGTTLNGSTLPTTETEKRVVPLDLFPSRLLDSVNVVKTYTPDKAGDFGSGVVELTTTDFPAGTSVKLSVGTAHVSGATGERFRRYSGGLSRLGAGGQAMPSTIPSGFLKRRSALSTTGYSPQELEAIGESLVGNWTGREVSSASPNSDLSLTFGSTFGRLGVVLSAVSTHGYDVTDEQQSYFGLDTGDVLVASNEYDLSTHREGTSTGYLGNFSYRLSDANRLYLNGVLTRDASSEDRYQEGLQAATGGMIRDYRVRYQIEQMLSTRLRGEHNTKGSGLGGLLEWNVARSTASNDSDLRENIYREGDSGVYELQTGFAESGKTEYFNLDDTIEQGGLTYSMFFAAPDGSWSGTVKSGIDRLERARDFDARRFRFTTANQLQFDLSGTPDEIFTAANIGPSGFEIREITGVNDAYDAAHSVSAGFLMSDVTFGKWRFIGGARYEESDQRVTTFNPFDTANSVESVNASRDILPSLNFVYALRPQTNIRVAYGRSLNRPEFRELSPFTFVEVAGGRSVAGNPELEQATIDSFDLRWEMFPSGGEVIAASAFYKMLDRPIERIIQPTSDLRQSFVNAQSASLWGLELELRKSLEALSPALRYWSVNANLAHINSNVTIGEDQLAVLTNAERPLEGQSDQVGNLAFQFYHPGWGSLFRVLGSYSGERLTEVGAFGLPDVYEASFTSFDAVFSQGLEVVMSGLELKLAASNILNARREFVQGGELQRAFDPGRKISLSFSYSPF
jgi:hypothetical protein